MSGGGRMKKVTILILHLNHGGMQKAVASLANMLSDTYKVEIVSIYDSKEKKISKNLLKEIKKTLKT